MAVTGLAATSLLPAAQELGLLTEKRALWLLVISSVLGVAGVLIMISAAWPTVRVLGASALGWLARRRPQSPIILQSPLRMADTETGANATPDRATLLAAASGPPPVQRASLSQAIDSIHSGGTPRDADRRTWIENARQRFQSPYNELANLARVLGISESFGTNRFRKAQKDLYTAISKGALESTIEDRFVEVYQAYFDMVEDAHTGVGRPVIDGAIKRSEYLDWWNADKELAQSIFDSAPAHLLDRLEKIGRTSRFHLS